MSRRKAKRRKKTRNKFLQMGTTKQVFLTGDFLPGGKYGFFADIFGTVVKSYEKCFTAVRYGIIKKNSIQYPVEELDDMNLQGSVYSFDSESFEYLKSFLGVDIKKGFFYEVNIKVVKDLNDLKQYMQPIAFFINTTDQKNYQKIKTLSKQINKIQCN